MPKFEILEGGLLQSPIEKQPLYPAVRNQVEQPIKEALGGESFESSFGRNVQRLGARGLESTIGLPRALGEGVQALANIPLGAVTGTEAPLGRSIPFLPSSQQVREYGTEPLVQLLGGQKEDLQPRGENEQFLDNVIEDAIPFLFGRGPQSLGKTAARALGISSAGNFSEYLADKVGFGKTGKTVAKVGAMIGTSLIGKPKAKQFATQLYQSAEENIPEDLIVNFSPIEKTLKEVNQSLKRGPGVSLEVPAKNFVKEFISDLRGKIKGTTKAGGENIELKELPAFKKIYNNLYSEGKVPKSAKPHIHKILESFNDAYKTAPDNMQPFIEQLKTADNIWAGIHSTNKISDFLNNNKTMRNIVLGGGALGTILKGISGSTILGGALGGAAIGATDFVRKISQYPALRSHYKNLLKSAASENVQATIKYAGKVSNYLDQKELPKKEMTQAVKQKNSAKGFEVLEGGLKQNT